MSPPPKTSISAGGRRRLSDAERAEKNWRARGRDIVQIYRGDIPITRPKGGKYNAAVSYSTKQDTASAFNILYANTEVMLPAAYSKPPDPVVQIPFRQEDRRSDPAAASANDGPAPKRGPSGHGASRYGPRGVLRSLLARVLRVHRACRRTFRLPSRGGVGPPAPPTLQPPPPQPGAIPGGPAAPESLPPGAPPPPTPAPGAGAPPPPGGAPAHRRSPGAGPCRSGADADGSAGAERHRDRRRRDGEGARHRRLRRELPRSGEMRGAGHASSRPWGLPRALEAGPQGHPGRRSRDGRPAGASRLRRAADPRDQGLGDRRRRVCLLGRYSHRSRSASIPTSPGSRSVICSTSRAFCRSSPKASSCSN